MVQDSDAGSKMSETEGRKWSKPIMEKRRRERINKSLDELKRLVLEAQNRDSSRYTKLEKADILEMTVKHLRGLRSRRKSISATTVNSNLIPTGVNVGCCRCVAEVGHCVIPDHVVMETSERTQTTSHVVGISTNAQERLYIDNNARGPIVMARGRSFTSRIPAPVSQGVVTQSRTLIPLSSSYRSVLTTFRTQIPFLDHLVSPMTLSAFLMESSFGDPFKYYFNIKSIHVDVKESLMNIKCIQVKPVMPVITLIMSCAFCLVPPPNHVKALCDY